MHELYYFGREYKNIVHWNEVNGKRKSRRESGSGIRYSFIASFRATFFTLFLFFSSPVWCSCSIESQMIKYCGLRQRCNIISQAYSMFFLLFWVNFCDVRSYFSKFNVAVLEKLLVFFCIFIEHLKVSLISIRDIFEIWCDIIQSEWFAVVFLQESTRMQQQIHTYKKKKERVSE